MYVGALILGLGTGAVYAAFGLGLVLTYRASGVVNLAHGAFAMYATYQYAELREVGDIVLPVVGLPPRVHLTDSPTFALAFTLSLAMAGLFGLLAYLVVFRPLRHAQPQTVAVAAVGLMISLQAVAVEQFGSDSRIPVPVLTQTPVSALGVTVPSDRLLLAGLVVTVGAALWAVSRWSRFGLATRAAADDSETLALFGYRPDLIAAANWVVASVLAAAAGVLVAPISGLNPSTYSLFVVPALAAALLGGLASFGSTVAGALALGGAQAVLVPLQKDLPWLNQPGLRALLPLLALIGVAVARGQLVPGRGTGAAESSRLPSSRLPSVEAPRHPLRALAAGLPAVVVALFVLDSPYRLGLERSLAGAVVCLSFVVLVGYVGQLSLAQMSLAGVAGFLLARLQGGLGVPFPFAPLVATAAAAAAGLLLGFAARRVRGIDLAVVTLAAGVAIQEAVFANPLVTGGLAGAEVPPPTLFGIDFGLAGPGFPRVQYGLLTLGVLAGCCYGVARLRAATTGRRMLAVRGNERAAAAAGVDVRRTKILAFTVSAGIAGLGGCLIGYWQGTLSFDSFGVAASLFFLAVAAVGGVTTITGALLGGLLVPGGLAFTALDRLAGLGTTRATLLCGVALVVLVVLRPAGIAPRRRQSSRPESPRPEVSGAPTQPRQEQEIRPTQAGHASRSEHDQTSVRLVVDRLSVCYERTEVVKDVSFTMSAGRITGLIGPNGAGKTTLIDALSGFLSSCGGAVELDGVRLGDMQPHLRYRRGLARTFQSLELFENLSVAENLALAGTPGELPELSMTHKGPMITETSGNSGGRERNRGVGPGLVSGLVEVASRTPATLSHDSRAAVALSRALAGHPRVLLLDEPAAGLDRVARSALVLRLRGLAATGLSILLVDHDIELVLRVCDDVIVLAAGQVVAHGPPAEIRGAPAVKTAYLGGRVGAKERADERGGGERGGGERRRGTPGTVTRRGAASDPAAGQPRAVLVVDRVVGGYGDLPTRRGGHSGHSGHGRRVQAAPQVIRGVSLTVGEGEIVALLGPNGAGKTTLIRMIANLHPPSGGRITVLGDSTRRSNPARIARRGMSVVPEGRGSIPSLTVRENLRLAARFGARTAGSKGRSKGIDGGLAARNPDPTESILEDFPPLRDLLDRTARGLSGGERQQLGLALALVRQPALLIIDEFSFGLAPGVAPPLLAVLRRVAEDAGTGILLVEQDISLALGVADRAYVLDRGRVTLSGSATYLAAQPELIEASYFGKESEATKPTERTESTE